MHPVRQKNAPAWGRSVVVAALMLACAVGPARAAERILAYHSDIDVYSDATLSVTETIRVRAEGQAIKRGIFRKFPLTRPASDGGRVKVGFRPEAVTRNGEEIDYYVEFGEEDATVYMGSRDVTIPPGEYTFTITYRTTHQLNAFGSEDELYWNVNGTRWDFPIDTVTARVVLPHPVPEADLRAYAYTGKQYEQGTDWEARVESPGVVFFSSTRPFLPRENLTVVLGFPKGVVSIPPAPIAPEPNDGQAVLHPFLIFTLAILVVLAYYVPVWYLFGKDPGPGVIALKTEPPRGWSPAALRYLREQAFDETMFTAVLVSLACKGAVTLGGEKNNFTVTRNPDAGTILQHPEEQAVFDALFSDGTLMLQLDKSEHKRFGRAQTRMVKAVRRSVNRRFMAGNGYLSFLGGLLSIGVFVAAGHYLLQGRDLIYVLGYAPYFFYGGFVTLIINGAFGMVLMRPTRQGRHILDQADGFVMALDGAAHLGGSLPHATAIFERYLPYAIALGREQAWADRMAEALRTLRAADVNYQPRWFDNRSLPDLHWATLPTFLTREFSDALGAAARRPRSSGSGSSFGGGGGGGGGGSSGGGGGGGGGGGF